MSWRKVSAEVGLAGLNPCEAARGGHVFRMFPEHARSSQPGNRDTNTRADTTSVSKFKYGLTIYSELIACCDCQKWFVVCTVQ